MIIKKISIIGLGLIGGSLAKAIKKKHPDSFITAIDLDLDSLETAKNERVADKITSDLAEGIKGADLVFLCTPIHILGPLIRKVFPLLDNNTIITDVGSTKQDILKVASEVFSFGDDQVFFIGGHPMAGTQYSGYGASLPHLFENAYYILTPFDHTPNWAIESLTELLTSLGALPLIMDGKTHDRIIGAISHLPHVVAAALVNTIKDLNDPSHLCERLAAGGFRDITRIASSSPEMWKNISLANREEVISLITHINKHLISFSKMLAHGKDVEVKDFFESAKSYRENLPVRQALNLFSYYDLYVDVEDRPGVIGEVTTLLGKSSINIKNLRIINSREGEPGSLIISLMDAPSLKKAQKILKENNYRTFIK